MNESKLRKTVRNQIRNVLSESDDSEWYQISRLVYDMKHDYPEVKDIGQKKVGGETVHEFALNDRVFQIRKVQ